MSTEKIMKLEKITNLWKVFKIISKLLSNFDIMQI